MTGSSIKWRRAALGEVCRIVSGSTPKTGVAQYWGGDINWVTPNDLSKDRAQVIHGGERTLSRAGYESCSTSLFPAGSVIVSSRAPIGYVAIAGGPMCTNQGCKTAVPPDFIDSRYLYWFLVNATPDLEARASGTTFKEISGKRFAETEFWWPPLVEQQHIVEILEDHLSRLDAAVGYVNRGGARVARLVDALATQHGTVSKAPRRPLSALLAVPLANGRSVPDGDGFPVLRLTCLRQDRVDVSERKLGRWSMDEASPFRVAAGDFLVARGNGSLRLVGRGGLVDEEPTDPVAYPDTLIRIRPRTDLIDPVFLSLVWNSRMIRAQIEAVARTTAGIYKVNQGQLHRIEIPLPSLSEQLQMKAEVLQQLDATKRVAAEASRIMGRTRSLRRSLLGAAFSGRMRTLSTSPSEEFVGV